MAQEDPPALQPAVITLAGEIDMQTSKRAAKELTSALTPGVGTIIADLTAATYCDSSGVRGLLLARKQAVASGVDLRLVIPPGPVLRIVTLLDLDGLLPIYPTLGIALAAHH